MKYTAKKERRSLEIVEDLQKKLDGAIRSLIGTKQGGPESQYLVWAANHVVQITAGYIPIRKSGLFYASKVLVRPVMETIFSILAVLKKKGVLYQKAHSEAQKEKKLPWKNDVNFLADIETDLRKFRAALLKSDPNYPIMEREVSVEECARLANLGVMYEYNYRIYCGFVHGTLRAFMGGWEKMTTFADNSIMSWSLLIVLSELKKNTPAHVPDLSEYWKEVNSAFKPKSVATKPRQNRS